MFDITVLMVMIMQIFIMLFSIYMIIKKPFDIGTILVLLYLVFYAFPAWDLYFGGHLFSDVILNYHVNTFDYSRNLYLIFITTLIMLAFYFGYTIMMGAKIKFNKNMHTETVNVKRFKYVEIGIILLWFIIFAYSYSKYNQSLLLFFSPSRKEGVFESSYIGILYRTLPTSFFVLNVIRDFCSSNKIRKKTLLLVIFPLLACMTTGQRREIVNLIIFVATLLVHIKVESNNKNITYNLKDQKYMRMKIIQLGVISILLIPTLWWGRVLFTQLQRSSINTTMPWHRRGFLELLFGSSSGGFKTLLLGLDHKEIFGLPWGYSIYFLFISFIPRSILPYKPLIINKLWQNDFNLSGNPSTFFINEMYINFGIIGIFFSFIFGILMSYTYYRFYNSKKLMHKIYSYIIFSNVITLFKNGFTQFIINIIMTIVIIGIPCKLVTNRKGRSVVKI